MNPCKLFKTRKLSKIDRELSKAALAGQWTKYNKLLRKKIKGIK